MCLIDAGEGNRWKSTQHTGRHAGNDTAAADDHFRRQEQKVDLTGSSFVNDLASLGNGHVGVDAGASDTVRQLGYLVVKEKIVSGNKTKTYRSLGMKTEIFSETGMRTAINTV